MKKRYVAIVDEERDLMMKYEIEVYKDVCMYMCGPLLYFRCKRWYVWILTYVPLINQYEQTCIGKCKKECGGMSISA